MKTIGPIKFILNWNRKTHIYLGLFLLLFIMLFSLSGLLLNNSHWKFAGFWEQRKEFEIVAPVSFTSIPDSLSLIRISMDQLDISGEVSNVKLLPGSIDFRVMKPGTIRDVHIDFGKKVSSQKVLKYNIWGKIRTLHAFNGLNKNKPEIRPNWIITKIWLLTMDGVAVGLILICLSSWLMWFEVRKNYSLGLYFLMAGVEGAIYFVFIVRLF